MSTSEMKQFGEKVRALRTGRGLTLKQLATALDMGTHSYLSELESGKKIPSAVLVIRLARFFGVPTDALLRDEVALPEQGGSG